MAPTHPKFLIVLILLISFGARMIAYAIPLQKSSIELLKKSNKIDPSDTSEENDQTLEKLKLTDLIIHQFNYFEFAVSANSKAKVFEDCFNLAYCHLPVLEQPPK